MTIPPLPSDESASNTWTAAKVNAMYDLLEFFRDNTPQLRVKQASQSISTGTDTNIDLDGETPDINVGTWVASATNDGWDCPETGTYWVTANVRFAAASSTGTRRAAIMDAGNEVARAELPDGSDTSNEVHLTVSDMVFLTSGDELHIEVHQDSGVSIFCSGTLAAFLVGSSAS